MPQFNLKFISALLILGLGVTEILVFNEEVFIFICFFIFFNLISVFVGNSIGQTFQGISNELEKSFLHSSEEAKTAISSLVLLKEQTSSALNRTILLLKVVQYGQIQLSLSAIYVAFADFKNQIFFLLGKYPFVNDFPINRFIFFIPRLFFLNAKKTLIESYSQKHSPMPVAAAFSSAPEPKQKARVADRLLSSGLLSSSKTMLS